MSRETCLKVEFNKKVSRPANFYLSFELTIRCIQLAID